MLQTFMIVEKDVPMLRKHHKLFIAVLTGLCAQTAFSSTDTPYSFLPYPYAFVATLSGGLDWHDAGTSQTLALTPAIVKRYKADNEGRWLVDGEIFLGVQTPLPRSLIGQIGLAFLIANDATMSGDIWDDGNQKFNNYNYRYEINHRHYAVKGKLLWDWGLDLGWGCNLLPWISASLGVGYNNAYNFTSSPSIPEAVRTPSFSGNTIRSFTYTLGIGFQYLLNKCWQAGIGYEFADWGKSKLGPARGQTQGDGLIMNHLYTNGIAINLTYLG